VVTHLEHVIVAGGASYVNNTSVILDDIEVLNWMENSHWQKVSINLPVPMVAFTPIITDDQLLIVGYLAANLKRDKMPTRYLLMISQDQVTNNKPLTHPPNGLQ